MRPERYNHKYPYLKSTAFRSWLYSYLLVLCLVIITSATFYVPMVSREKQKTYTQYELIADGLLQEIDKEFSALVRFISLTSQDSDLTAYARAYELDKVSEISDGGQRIRELVQQLSYYTIGLNYMEDYIVYFPGSDYVYRNGSFIHGDLFFDVSVGKSYALLRNRQVAAGIDLFSVEDETGERFVFYTYGAEDLYIYVQINTNVILQILSQYAQMIDGAICLMDEDGQLLIGSGDADGIAVLAADLLEDGAWYTQNGTSRLLRDNEDGHLRVLFSVSEKMITRGLAKLYFLILGSLIASAICGCCLSVLLARKNYRQFDALAREVIGDEERQHANYPILIDAVQSHTEIMNELRKQVWRDGIQSVMHKDEDSWQMRDTDLDDLEKLLLDRFIVCTFLPVSYNGWKATFPNDTQGNLLYRRILLPLQTLLGEGYTIEEAEAEHTYSVIIGCCGTQEANRRHLSESLRTFLAEQESQGIYICIAASHFHMGVFELRRAGLEARVGMKHLSPQDDLSLLFEAADSSLIVQETEGYFERKRFTTYMLNGRLAEARAMIEEEVVHRRKSKKFSYQNHMMFYVEVLNAMTIAVVQEPRLSAEKRSEILLVLESALQNTQRGVESRFDTLCAIMDKLCRECGEDGQVREDEKQKQLIEQIESAVDTHLTEYDLNISTLADMLSRNPKYIAIRYKEYTGENLLVYIQRRRIERYKALVADTGIDLEKAAVRVGYSSIATFNRWFKRFENCTPGAYMRSLNKPEDANPRVDSDSE